MEIDTGTDDLLGRIDGHVAVLTFNRPERRNALSDGMYDGFARMLPLIEQNPDIRVLLVTGAGGAFCAGGDVKGFAGQATTGGDGGRAGAGGFNMEARVQGLRSGMELSRWLHEMPKPTLAVIPGPAAGAGLSLALACDLRIASETAKLTTAFAKVGLAGDYGGSYFLTQLVGAAKARELYFTADVISGAQAHALGIVNKVAPAAELDAAARAYARQLASLPTVALGYMKKNLNAAQHASLNDVLDLEAMHMIRTFMTEDHKGAAVAFVEKRAPIFKGR